MFRSGTLTPSMQSREVAIDGEQSELELIRERLHVSAVPKTLPCRENEFDNVYSFVKGKINDECGGCIYISGVPGTGAYRQLVIIEQHNIYFKKMFQVKQPQLHRSSELFRPNQNGINYQNSITLKSMGCV